MNILLLSPYRGSLAPFLESFGDRVTITNEKLRADNGVLSETDFIVSYGYRHIICQEVVERFEGKIVNLHISYLPFNRGADPNFWSFYDETIKGVTIHLIDEGIDTGGIIAQQQVKLEESETLATSYHKLGVAIEDLFKNCWGKFRAGKIVPQPQEGHGTYHNSADKTAVFDQLQLGWNTPVKQIVELGRQSRCRREGADA